MTGWLFDHHVGWFPTTCHSLPELAPRRSLRCHRRHGAARDLAFQEVRKGPRWFSKSDVDWEILIIEKRMIDWSPHWYMYILGVFLKNMQHKVYTNYAYTQVTPTSRGDTKWCFFFFRQQDGGLAQQKSTNIGKNKPVAGVLMATWQRNRRSSEFYIRGKKFARMSIRAAIPRIFVLKRIVFSSDDHSFFQNAMEAVDISMPGSASKAWTKKWEHPFGNSLIRRTFALASLFWPNVLKQMMVVVRGCSNPLASGSQYRYRCSGFLHPLHHHLVTCLVGYLWVFGYTSQAWIGMRSFIEGSLLAAAM